MLEVGCFYTPWLWASGSSGVDLAARLPDAPANNDKGQVRYSGYGAQGYITVS